MNIRQTTPNMLWIKSMKTIQRNAFGICIYFDFNRFKSFGSNALDEVHDEGGGQIEYNGPCIGPESL